MKKTTVWIYDDLWEEGYRFDDIVTKRFCFIERKYASNEHNALEFLIAAYKFIPKNEGTSNLQGFQMIDKSNLPCVVIMEDV